MDPSSVSLHTGSQWGSSTVWLHILQNISHYVQQEKKKKKKKEIHTDVEQLEGE